MSGVKGWFGGAVVAMLAGVSGVSVVSAPVARAEGLARMVLDVGPDAPEGGWLAAGMRIEAEDAGPLDIFLLYRADGALTGVYRAADDPLRNDFAALPAIEVERVAMAEGEVLAARAEDTGYSPAERIGSGAAFITSGVPLPGDITGILRLACAVPPALPAGGAGAGGEDETLEEKIERLCPGGDCTAKVREAVELVIQWLRKTGHDRAADLLQELLDKGRFVVDKERRFSTPGECAVFYYNPFIGPKVISISPECLCEDGFAANIATMAGVLALRAKNDYDDELAALVLLAGAALDLLDAKEREKLKQTLGGLLKIAIAVERGFPPALSCFIQAILKVICFDPKRRERSVEELRRLNEKKKELVEMLEDLTEEDLQRIKETIEERLKRIIELIKAGAWDVLRIEFGLVRECFDPEFLRFHHRESKPSVPESPKDIEEGDIDGDGDPDIVTPGGDAPEIAIVPGFGDGDVGEVVVVDEPAGPESLAIGDMDGGGRADLVVATENGELALLRTLRPGTLDLSRAAFPLGGRASDLALADVDDDGALDVVVSDIKSRRLRLLFNRGGLVLEEAEGDGGGFPIEGEPGPLAVGTIVAGRAPHAAVAVGSAILVFPSLAGPGGPFGVPIPLEAGADRVRSLAFGDVDADGALDLVASAVGAGIVRFIGDGASDFRRAPPLPMEAPGALRLGDADRDGRLDLLVLEPEAGLLHVFYAPGAAGEPAPAFYEAGGFPSALALPDLDGDGFLDVAVANQGSSDLAIFRNLTIPPRDIDRDGIEDGCAIRAGLASDCDADGVPDGGALEAGLATDADGSGLPDACDRRFSLGWESRRIPVSPAGGEVEVGVPIALLQLSEGGDLLDVRGLSFGITWDPEQLDLLDVALAPPLAEAAGLPGAHLSIEPLEARLILDMALSGAPLGLPAAEALDLLMLRFATRGVAGATRRVATRLALDELPPLAVSPAPPRGWVQAAGGLFRITGAGEGGEAMLVFEPPVSERFRRGDSNVSGAADISDAIYTLSWLFSGGSTPVCMDAADGNDDGTIDLSDAVFVLNFLFLGTAAPPPPGPETCGEDGSPDDELSVCEYPAGPCG